MGRKTKKLREKPTVTGNKRDVMIRDSVHGTINIGESFKKLIDTAAMQRLRYVNQLGFANLLFPGANGSRFEHALGTYRLSEVIGERLLEFIESIPAGISPINVQKDDLNLLTTASLLHDLGHAPYSHALDEFHGFNHEKATKEKITKSDIADILRDEFGLDPHSVAQVVYPTRQANETERLMADILSGPLGIDMLDYLQRDALYTGVPYGRIDVDRLFATIELHPEGKPELVVNDKGIVPVESIFFSRYHMFTSVYLHHVLRIVHSMLREAVKLAIDKDELIQTKQLANLRDSDIIYKLEFESKNREAIDLIRKIRHRQLHKRLGTLSWNQLEQSGFSEPEINTFIAEREHPEKINDRRKQLYAEILNDPTFNLTEMNDSDIILDYPPIVSKSVSTLKVRLRHRRIGEEYLVNLSDKGVSAIGAYVGRAYKLIWKMRIIGWHTISPTQHRVLLKSWNRIFPRLKMKIGV